MSMDDVVVVIVCMCIAIVAGIVACEALIEYNLMSLGDEVVTSDEYNVYFNDSFSGRIIVTKDSMYTVRDMDGCERVFDKKWLVKVNRE